MTVQHTYVQHILDYLCLQLVTRVDLLKKTLNSYTVIYGVVENMEVLHCNIKKIGCHDIHKESISCKANPATSEYNWFESTLRDAAIVDASEIFSNKSYFDFTNQALQFYRGDFMTLSKCCFSSWCSKKSVRCCNIFLDSIFGSWQYITPL